MFPCEWLLMNKTPASEAPRGALDGVQSALTLGHCGTGERSLLSLQEPGPARPGSCHLGAPQSTYCLELLDHQALAPWLPHQWHDLAQTVSHRTSHTFTSLCRVHCGPWFLGLGMWEGDKSTTRLFVPQLWGSECSRASAPTRIAPELCGDHNLQFPHPARPASGG